MSKQEAIMHYKAAVAIFKKWLETGLISEEEFAIIDTITGEKYGLNSTSIYREICSN
jgi:hypothetical protein